MTPRRQIRSELDLRGLFQRLAFLADIEELLRRESHRAGEQCGRKLLDAGIVLLDRVVEESPRCRDLVLDIRKLCLQLLEVLAGFEVRVGLAQRKQLSERTAERVFRRG